MVGVAVAGVWGTGGLVALVGAVIVISGCSSVFGLSSGSSSHWHPERQCVQHVGRSIDHEQCDAGQQSRFRDPAEFHSPQRGEPSAGGQGRWR